MESPPKVGWTGRHAVELYVRTYTTMLQSSGDIKVESLVQAHLGMGSVLHPLAAEPQSDMGALLYAVRRLPDAISRGRHVVMGQSPQGFRAVLGADILSWKAVKAPARRRLSPTRSNGTSCTPRSRTWGLTVSKRVRPRARAKMTGAGCTTPGAKASMRPWH